MISKMMRLRKKNKLVRIYLLVRQTNVFVGQFVFSVHIVRKGPQDIETKP